VPLSASPDARVAASGGVLLLAGEREEECARSGREGTEPIAKFFDDAGVGRLAIGTMGQVAAMEEQRLWPGQRDADIHTKRAFRFGSWRGVVSAALAILQA